MIQESYNPLKKLLILLQERFCCTQDPLVRGRRHNEAADQEGGIDVTQEAEEAAGGSSAAKEEKEATL
jgi:hypothetical protein